MEIQHSSVARWTAAETRFRANRYHGEGLPGAVELHVRDSSVLLTASHALTHFRDGRRKPVDLRTGGLAVIAAVDANVSALLPVGPIGNWASWAERDDAFRAHLDSMAGHLIIDVHGMADRHGSDVCLGLGPSPSPRVHAAADLIARRLTGYTVTVNVPFDGRAPHTVTSYVQGAGGHSLQVEVAARLRDVDGRPTDAGRFLDAFVSALREVDASWVALLTAHESSGSSRM